MHVRTARRWLWERSRSLDVWGRGRWLRWFLFFGIFVLDGERVGGGYVLDGYGCLMWEERKGEDCLGRYSRACASVSFARMVLRLSLWSRVALR